MAGHRGPRQLAGDIIPCVHNVRVSGGSMKRAERKKRSAREIKVREGGEKDRMSTVVFGSFPLLRLSLF